MRDDSGLKSTGRKVMIRSIKKVKLGGIWELDVGGDGDKVYLGKDL